MFNKIILIGNLTRDVELRYTGNGAAIATFGLAVNKQWKDRNSGEKREEVCYIDVSIFGVAAEVANSHLGKGRRILVEGELVFEQWQDQSGQKRSKHKVRCESFKFLDSQSESNGQANNQGQQHNEQQQSRSQSSNGKANYGNVDIDDTDVPF